MVGQMVEYMDEVISKALCKYKNLILMGDFDIDIKRSNSEKDKLNNFWIFLI